IRKGSCALWSRGNELISEQFPELLEALNAMDDGTVLDGEILAYENQSPLPFGELQKRLGRKNVSKNIIKNVPIIYMVYDLLEHEGQDLRALTLRERRRLFSQLKFPASMVQISKQLEYTDWETLLKLRHDSRRHSTEGIMLKKWNSTYGVGRQKGFWWKYKVDPLTIDAVLLYAQAGSGRRANLFTDYTFGIWKDHELIPITKAYSGLNQAEINELDAWIRKNTEEKFGPVRKVKPFHVFEIAFEGIQISKRHKSGVALRFPRIARWRRDKPCNEADSLTTIRESFFHEK
ncbi:MAG: cisplatin damage response ATP-dependent DNA ligase, partial [Parachlamydiaceae bacterium]